MNRRATELAQLMAGIMLQHRGLLGMQGIKNLSGRRDERTKLPKEQSEQFAAINGCRASRHSGDFSPWRSG